MGNERERSRIKSRVDELPNEIQELLNKRLADVNFSYVTISEELTELGYPISKSSIGRYAIRHGGAAKRLKESAEKIRALAEVVKDNRDIEASEVAGSIMMDMLIERLATAQEEMDDMPLEKVGKLVVALQRSAVFKAKFKLEYDRGFGDAFKSLKKALADELQKEPELLQKMLELADKVEEERKDK